MSFKLYWRVLNTFASFKHIWILRKQVIFHAVYKDHFAFGVCGDRTSLITFQLRDFSACIQHKPYIHLILSSLTCFVLLIECVPCVIVTKRVYWV